ncbi:MAG: glycosyltransferase family 2 protein [Enhydrobacter sp.]|nr:MAG: glycosyltransferase family 2 protein [Enhydrobacter sp.]
MVDVTVIVPTFNRLWALPRAIDSCRSQGCRVEVIVVDDGSSDGTWDWLQSQGDVVGRRTANWGKDWAVVEAMKIATGEYVRFLDSDDWLCPGANEEQFQLGRREGADVVLAGYQDFHEDADRLEPHPWVDCDDFVAQQFGEAPFSHYSAFLFRREFIRDIPHRQEFALRDDRMFMLEVAIAGPRLAVHGKPAFVHRHHRRGRLQGTQGFRRTLADWTTVAVYRKAVELLTAKGELTARRKRAAVRFIWPVVRSLAQTAPDEAAAAAEWIFRLDPEFVPPVRPSIRAGYRLLGFGATERLIGLGGLLRKPPPRSVEG